MQNLEAHNRQLQINKKPQPRQIPQPSIKSEDELVIKRIKGDENKGKQPFYRRPDIVAGGELAADIVDELIT